MADSIIMSSVLSVWFELNASNDSFNFLNRLRTVHSGNEHTASWIIDLSQNGLSPKTARSNYHFPHCEAFSKTTEFIANTENVSYSLCYVTMPPDKYRVRLVFI